MFDNRHKRDVCYYDETLKTGNRLLHSLILYNQGYALCIFIMYSDFQKASCHKKNTIAVCNYILIYNKT